MGTLEKHLHVFVIQTKQSGHNDLHDGLGLDLCKALNKTLSSTFSFFTRCVNVVTKKHVAKVVWAYSGKRDLC